MDKKSQSDREDHVVTAADTRPVDDEENSIQAILYQLLEKTDEMASRLDKTLVRAGMVRCEVEDATEDRFF